MELQAGRRCVAARRPLPQTQAHLRASYRPVAAGEGHGGHLRRRRRHPDSYATDGSRTLLGVEAVIDKDWASELLARDLKADVFVIATDADGVYLDWGTPRQRRLERTTPAELGEYSFPAGSMGPKVGAVCHFVESTGHRAAIGALKDIERIVDGKAGTIVGVKCPMTDGRGPVIFGTGDHDGHRHAARRKGQHDQICRHSESGSSAKSLCIGQDSRCAV